MPLYLLLDLLGKFLIVSSVGCQLLWLAPISASCDTNRQDMVQMKAGNENPEDLRKTLALQWDSIRSAGIEQYAIQPEEIRWTSYIGKREDQSRCTRKNVEAVRLGVDRTRVEMLTFP